MYYGDVIGLLIATFGTGVVFYYAKEEPRMRIVTRILISVIIFLWVGFGLLWLNQIHLRRWEYPLRRHLRQIEKLLIRLEREFEIAGYVSAVTLWLVMRSTLEFLRASQRRCAVLARRYTRSLRQMTLERF
jgi:hypothetical protein